MQVWTLGTVRKGSPQNPTTPLELRDYKSAGSHPTEPGGWHLTYALFAPTLYLKYIGLAELGVVRMAKMWHIADVHKHLAALRDLSTLLTGREVRTYGWLVCEACNWGGFQDTAHKMV